MAFSIPTYTPWCHKKNHDIHIYNALTAIESAASPDTHIISLAQGFFDDTGSSLIADKDGKSYYADDDHVNTLGTQTLISPTLLPVLESIANDSQSTN